MSHTHPTKAEDRAAALETAAHTPSRESPIPTTDPAKPRGPETPVTVTDPALSHEEQTEHNDLVKEVKGVLASAIKGADADIEAMAEEIVGNHRHSVGNSDPKKRSASISESSGRTLSADVTKRLREDNASTWDFIEKLISMALKIAAAFGRYRHETLAEHTAHTMREQEKHRTSRAEQ